MQICLPSDFNSELDRLHNKALVITGKSETSDSGTKWSVFFFQAERYMYWTTERDILVCYYLETFWIVYRSLSRTGSIGHCTSRTIERTNDRSLVVHSKGQKRTRNQVSPNWFTATAHSSRKSCTAKKAKTQKDPSQIKHKDHNSHSNENEYEHFPCS